MLHDLEIRRTASYLATWLELVWVYNYQLTPKSIVIETHCDWAGDEITRRSRGGGFEYFGSHVSHGWASQQAHHRRRPRDYRAIGICISKICRKSAFATSSIAEASKTELIGRLVLYTTTGKYKY